MQGSGSQPFLPRSILSQLYQYFEAPRDAKIGLKVNKSDNWRHPWHCLTPPSWVMALRLRTTDARYVRLHDCLSLTWKDFVLLDCASQLSFSSVTILTRDTFLHFRVHFPMMRVNYIPRVDDSGLFQPPLKYILRNLSILLSHRKDYLAERVYFLP